MHSRATHVLRGLLLFASAMLVGCDHASKALAQQALGSGRVIEIVSGVLDLRYTENHDVAFSLFQRIEVPHKALWLALISGVVLVATLVTWWRRRHAGWGEACGYALVSAGAIGNLVDRLARGFVVDFIHLKHWPVFNVADVLIVVGLVLLATQASSRARDERADRYSASL